MTFPLRLRQYRDGKLRVRTDWLDGFLVAVLWLSVAAAVWDLWPW